MSIQKVFSKNLKRLRERKGLSQEALAEKLNISARYIQKLEGKACPNIGIETISKLSKILKAKPSEFLEE